MISEGISLQAIALIRERLDTQKCRCALCNGPATREYGYNGALFCDEHKAAPGTKHTNPIKAGSKPYRDLLGADWIRKAIALLREYDGCA